MSKRDKINKIGEMSVAAPPNETLMVAIETLFLRLLFRHKMPSIRTKFDPLKKLNSILEIKKKQIRLRLFNKRSKLVYK